MDLGNADLIKNWPQMLHRFNTEMTADSAEKNRFNMRQLWDDWVWETLAEPDWLTEMKHGQLIELGSGEGERGRWGERGRMLVYRRVPS